jgi:NAD(P)-dependent dehydrogenase (short-subunit alcohol dehydrogenase family)
VEELQGRVAVVTGGASGIGKAMAERFLREGMAVAIADVETGALGKTAAELSASGEIEGFLADVSDQESVDELATRVIERFGTVDVVCNNAGVGGHLGRAWETPIEDWQWVLGVNLMGVIHGIRSFVPTLVAKGSGHVVNTSSTAGWAAPAAMSPYAASKHAVLAISEALRGELAESNVGVSVLCPGGVRTNILEAARNWPTRLGDPPETPRDPLTTEVNRRAIDALTVNAVEPEIAADAVVAAIKANRFVVTTDLDVLCAAAEARLAAARRAQTPPA